VRGDVVIAKRTENTQVEHLSKASKPGFLARAFAEDVQTPDSLRKIAQTHRLSQLTVSGMIWLAATSDTERGDIHGLGLRLPRINRQISSLWNHQTSYF